MDATTRIGVLPIAQSEAIGDDLAVAATIQVRVFRCASDIVGGELQLSNQLGVRQRDLSRWLADREICPLPTFLGAVDIILKSEAGFAAIFTSRTPTLH